MKKIYIKPQIEQITTYEDTAICIRGSLYDADMPAKGGNNDFGFDDEDEDEDGFFFEEYTVNW